MNLGDLQYINLKNQGLISYSVNGEQVYISQKRFDPVTGNPVADKVIQTSINEIQNTITNLQTQIDNFNLILADANLAIVNQVIATPQTINASV